MLKENTAEKLAIDGGKPVRDQFLPFCLPEMGREEEKELIDTLRSGWLTTGPKTKQFEKDFARFCDVKHAVGLNSCTAALHLALVAIGVGAADEVITSPMTFASTANVIVHTGAKPVFVDIEPRTLNIDAEEIEKKITSRTKAIIPVHFMGQPCDMDRIMEIARKHKLYVIEDAAHAVGSVYKGKKIGSIGHMTAFSFYATKNITTGEGGMLTTNDDELAEKIRILSLHGISRDAWKRYSAEGYKHWDIIYPGYKYNMFDIQAALGIHQLRKVDVFWEKRKECVEFYNKNFSSTEGIEPVRQEAGTGCKSSYHLYIVLIKSEALKKDRDFVMNAVQKENIGVGIHFRAIHLHPFYTKTYGFKKGDFPNAEYASDRVLSLPLYTKLKKSDLSQVVETLRRVLVACV